MIRPTKYALVFEHSANTKLTYELHPFPSRKKCTEYFNKLQAQKISVGPPFQAPTHPPPHPTHYHHHRNTQPNPKNQKETTIHSQTGN